jgi:hypothetical protein
VMMAERPHLFPFRTQKLSSPAPIVLGTGVPGRVGRCQDLNLKSTPKGCVFYFRSRRILNIDKIIFVLYYLYYKECIEYR